MKYERILVIPDQHFPYNHKDLLPFLRAVKKKYNPDKVVNLGDECDYHNISFHDSHPDLSNSSDELSKAIAGIKKLAKLFPVMNIVESNHGSLVLRRAIASGLPTKVLKSYNEILQVPKAWHWSDDLIVKCSNGAEVYFCHGRSKNGLGLSKNLGMNVVQGHFHEDFKIEYWANDKDLYWSMFSGCLIDRKSLAYAYAKLNLNKQIIGCSIIINGQPKLIPMLLNKHGRWVGNLR